MRNKLKIFFVLLCVIICGNTYAQDFGFDNNDSGLGGSASAITVTVGGEVSASFLGYIDDFSEGTDNINFGDIFSGKLNFSAGTSFADGVINLKIQTTEQPISVEEAYVRAYFGGLEIEGGLRKLTWGKADSFGPLDVINPLDYTELTDLSDIMNLKIARPLVHASYRIGSFSKIEAVFVPTFEPLRYATSGRWEPAQVKLLNENLNMLNDNLSVIEAGNAAIGNVFINDQFDPDELSTLKYAQAGVRFTTTIGPADIGFQYYYGRLTRPAFSVTSIVIPPMPPYTTTPQILPTEIHYDYNPYHQIGIDWAQVLLGFNVRAEFAANITEDLNGDNGAVYNPSLLWSFGFDRDLFWGINLNFQCNESIRLLNDNVGNDPLIVDTETGTDITSTQIIAALSKKFFRDELEVRVAVLWEIEGNDFLLMPAIIWTKDTLSVELSGGIFGGNEDGQFGQYYKNNFIKVSLMYSF